LIGIAAGVAHALLATLSGVLPAKLGIAQMGLPRTFQVPALDGVASALGAVIALLNEATLVALVMMVLLVAMTVIFRRRRLASFVPVLVLAAMTIYAFVTSLGGQSALTFSLLDD